LPTRSSRVLRRCASCADWSEMPGIPSNVAAVIVFPITCVIHAAARRLLTLV
jgi:hypothetical protein